MNFWKYENKNRRNLNPGTQGTYQGGNIPSDLRNPQNPQNMEQGEMMDPRLQEINNMPNPFQNQNFNNSLPDIPIQDSGAAMLNSLLNDDAVPEDVKKEFWFVFHRDNVLTFLDKDRKASKLLGFDIMKIDKLNNTPYYDYTFDIESKWTAARQILEVKLDRALGNGKTNERLAIPLTVTENINRMEDSTSNAGSQKEGFLKKLLNRRN
jgi:hypothetical protein